ncbi:uncharacterized protein LAJ45_03680 [Morchella importuna]|uniref:uncharacterized protein n=1 Tax=Morchella importuna TaxID=1174673 RepID=UPI001E8ED00C|nr:uncharacterized protein LAJ45_03680 [Morchella importuna]KAH8152254.1 hypothetical protein LAJ45_03680 [Morchella importuna]
MLQPYSARGQIRTLQHQYHTFGQQRRDTLKRLRQTRTMYMIAYDHVGKGVWDNGAWKKDKGLRLLAKNLRRLEGQERVLRERLGVLESEAWECFGRIGRMVPALVQRGEGTREEVERGGREGFSFEV